MSAPADATPPSPSERDAAFAPLAAAAHLLVAVSGGPDSMALLGLLAAWSRDRGGPDLSAATVDHGLRPEAGAEATAVADWCASLGVPHVTLTWPRKPGDPRTLEAARRARYRLLVAEAGASGATHLVTAHHADDQAETLLMRLAAGTGPAGLAGMRPSVGRGGIVHARPCLAWPKARLVAACVAKGWPFVTDPSNAAERTARGRWRRLAPMLAEEGLDARRLGSLARRMARADAALSESAAAALVRVRREDMDDGLVLDMTRLASDPEEIGLRVLSLAIASVVPPARDEASLRLERLEACHAAMVVAVRSGRTLRRTLSGCVLSLDRGGLLIVTAEGVRHRGRQGALTVPATETPRSLGTEARRT